MIALAQRGTAFGFRFESDLPLPVGQSRGTRPKRSLWVRRGEAISKYPADRRLAGVGSFSEVEGLVSPARRTVWISRTGQHPGALWGTVMGLALPHLLGASGAAVLHASCASKDGIAVAFLGPQRAGKSTVAAALLTQGWRLLADDAVVLSVGGARIRVAPSFPAIRLWAPQAFRLAAELALERVPIHPGIDKDWVLLGEREWHYEGNPNLACLCLLAGAQSDSLRGSDKVLALLRATYDSETRSQARWRQCFELAHLVASSVPILSLRLPSKLSPDFRLASAVTRQLQVAGVL